jgi:hypothetical protein
MLTASLQVLARLAGQGRSTVAEGIKRLAELGLIQKIKRRVRVAWGGSVASRVVANAYRLLVTDTESSRQTAREQTSIISIMETPSLEQRVAAKLLENRRKQLEARWIQERSAQNWPV